MMNDTVQELFDRNPDYSELAFEGKCHDCDCEVTVAIERDGDNGELFEVSGGALYNPNGTTEPSEMFLKCDKCFCGNKTLENFQDNEVYSRVVGYLRPVKQWNASKSGEFKERTNFNLRSIDELEKAASQTV